MGKRWSSYLAVAACSFGLGGVLPAKSFALKNPWCQRHLHVTRHYEIAVKPGQPNVAAIPALRSYMGATNWQVIKASHFRFSESPSSYKIVSDNLGLPRHSFELTWAAPKADKVTVDQDLDVDLTWFSTLYTAAKLPYDAATLARYAPSLGVDADEGVDPTNPQVMAVAGGLAAPGGGAEETVERVCDWINDHIEYAKGKRSLQEALSERMGSCTPMAMIACSILRRLGIPSEPVDAVFSESGNGHTFIEVYFTDAGWVFYDLSNWNRGFKSLDCLTTRRMPSPLIRPRKAPGPSCVRNPCAWT
jgi:transglutaminase-like putative cysteine protease